MTQTSVHLTERGGLNFHMFVNSGPGLASNAVLVEGLREAVLIDTSLLLSDAAELVALVKATGRDLKAILISHAHPDHYAGLPLFKQAFPNTPILARQGVIDGIIEWPAKKLHWQDMFGDDIPLEMVLPERMTGDHFDIEGRAIAFIDLPPAETVHATAFYMPELSTLIAGDLLFESTHLYMADTNNPLSWLSAIDLVRKQGKLDLVFPGHGKAGGTEILDMTGAWLDYYHQVAKPGVRFPEIAKAMYEKFPGYGLAIVLWLTRGPGFGLGGAVEAGVPPEVLGG